MVRLADAELLGVSRAELSSLRWHRLGPGVRAWHEQDELDPLLRIRAVGVRMPKGAVIGGWASLRWQGVTGIDGKTGPGGRTPLPVLVHVGQHGRLAKQPGLLVDRGRLDDADVIEVDGLRVTVAGRAVFDVMCRDGPEEGLVVGDLAWKAGLVTQTEMARRVAASPPVRRIASARLAVPLLDKRVRSIPESRFRYVWVVEAGLPKPLVNRGIVDDEGFLIGEADLLDPEAAMVGEYDGEGHRELGQHTHDNVREESFEGLNLQVVRATSIDLWPKRRRLVQRLQQAHARGLDRDASKDSWGIRTS